MRLDYLHERRVGPSPRRLAWMIRSAELLTPRDGRRWREYRSRVIEHPERDAALALLERGVTTGIDRKLVLEGATSADCLIECEHAVIWVEGKRNDWLEYSATRDVTRDQLRATPRRRGSMPRPSAKIRAWSSATSTSSSTTSSCCLTATVPRRGAVGGHTSAPASAVASARGSGRLGGRRSRSSGRRLGSC